MVQIISVDIAPLASAALTWSEVTSPANTAWRDISTNQDGSVLAIVSDVSNSFYRSRDFGATWSLTTSTSPLRAVAVSGDGARAIAAHDSKIYKSVYAASSWSTGSLAWSAGGTGENQRCGSNYGPNFNSLASSSNGASWIAGVRDESCVYTSVNNGDSWYGVSVGAVNWASAMSADGNIKITGNSNNKIYKQIGAGAWASIGTEPVTSNGWWDIACDATCTHMAAVTNGIAKIYISSDSGATWINGNSSVLGYGKISMSSDGTKIAATNGSNIYVSQDSGLTWEAQSFTHSGSFTSVVISKDGTKIYSSTGDGHIWKSAFLANQSALSVTSISGVFGTSLTLASSGGSGSGATTYSYAPGTTTCSLSDSVLTPNGAGTCLVTATKAADSTYNAISSIQTTVTFSPGPQSALSITSISGRLGATLALTTSGGSGSGSVSYVVDSGPCSVSGSSLTASSAGTCYLTATKAAAGNYLIQSSSSTAITISKGIPTISVSASGTARYGSLDTLTVSTSVAGVISISKSSVGLSGCINIATVANTMSCIWTPNGVGSTSLNVAFTPTDSSNYVDSSTVFIRSVSNALITVTPTAGQSKLYGANNPTLGYSITSGALIGSDVLTGSLTYTGTNVGSYPISIGTLANASYTITLASVNFAITQANQSAVSLSSLSTSYNPSNKTVALTGSGGSGTGTYTTSLDASNTTPGCSVSGTTLTYSTAGTCVIAVTRAGDTNYVARTDVVSFSIGLAVQSITFGLLSAKNYSSDTFTVSATSSAGLSVTFTSGSPSVCTTSGTYGSIITLLGVGTCVINANQVGDANTAAASQVSQNFVVNPRPVTITADSKTKVYGGADPALTYTITTGNLILGDTLNGSITKASGNDVGSYQIQQGTLTTANNPKYAITFISDSFTVTRATPVLALTYPSSNTAIVRPGAVDTPTVTTSSSAGALTFASSASSSICVVDTSTGVISLLGAGNCVVVMTSAQTTNYFQSSETTTVTLAVLSTSLTGIDSSKLVSMGQPFYSHPSIDQSYSFSIGSNGATVAIPAGTLDPLVPISISLLTDSTDQQAIISSTGTSVLSVVVSWVASDGSVPSTNTGKAISVTLSNPAIKSGAKIYSVFGNQSQLLGTATSDGSVTTSITDDPVLVVMNPLVTPSAPTSSGGGVSTSVSSGNDNAALMKAAQEKAAQEKAASELKIATDLKAAQEKAALELQIAREKAAAELKAAQDAADTAAALKAEEEAKIAAALKAEEDAKIAANLANQKIVPEVTLYSLSSSLKLASFDLAYLKGYIRSLKPRATVTCIGYIYSKNSKPAPARALAQKQASALCSVIKKLGKSLILATKIEPVSKAPKAAQGAKWVAVSYRIDGFQSISTK